MALCRKMAEGNDELLNAIAEGGYGYTYADMENLAIIIKRILVFPDGHFAVELISGNYVYFSFIAKAKIHIKCEETEAGREWILPVLRHTNRAKSQTQEEKILQRCLPNALIEFAQRFSEAYRKDNALSALRTGL